MSTALDAKVTYYGVKLGPNSVETDDGFRIYRNAVIARTGTQVYKAKEISATERAALGITVDDDTELTLWRDPEEVFSAATIASFEGVSLTDEHPDTGEMLSCDDAIEYHGGHIQNVRKGTEPLESGDLPLLGDVRVIDQRLISKIDAGVRYLSCGYKYHLAKMGDRLLQVDIRGNHVAVVPKGRAGPAARLADAAPQTEKEKHPVKKNKDYFIGLGLSQFAKDAPPEEVAAAVKELAFDSAAESSKKDDKSDEKSSGKDSGSKGKDAGGSDYRDRMHKAVDMLCDKRDAMANSGEADIAELHNLLSGAPALDADKDDEDDEKSKGKDAKAEDADAEDEDMSEAEDDGASVIEPFSEEEKPENPSAATDSALEVLKRLRPAIARSKDPRLKGAFDSELKRLQPAVRSGDKGKGGYGGFAQAAAVSTGKDSDPFSGQPESPLMKQKRETDEAYAKSRAAKRGEVK